MGKALTNLMSSLKKARAIADDIDDRAQFALQDTAEFARHETTMCAVTVIVSGFLESFLREIAEETISEICGRNVPFKRLPQKIQITHFRDGALHIKKIAGGEMGLTSDAARRLASVTEPALPY